MVNDSELIMMIHNGNEELIQEIISKNKYIINYTLKKYSKTLNNFGISIDEAYNEAIKSLIDALNYYNEDKNTSFSTYYKMVIDNKMKTLINEYSNKNKILNEALINSDNYENGGITIEQLAIDVNNNPLERISEKEWLNNVINLSKEYLSNQEFKVFIMKITGHSDKEISILLRKDINIIYNTVYRIKCKMKKIIEKTLEM